MRSNTTRKEVKLLVETGTTTTERELSSLGKIFWSAANLILNEGWMQCGTLGKGGPHCLMGALSESFKEEHGGYPAFGDLGIPGTGMDLVRWNDDRSRTKEQVVAKLREIATSV